MCQFSHSTLYIYSQVLLVKNVMSNHLGSLYYHQAVKPQCWIDSKDTWTPIYFSWIHTPVIHNFSSFNGEWLAQSHLSSDTDTPPLSILFLYAKKWPGCHLPLPSVAIDGNITLFLKSCYWVTFSQEQHWRSRQRIYDLKFDIWDILDRIITNNSHPRWRL